MKKPRDKNRKKSVNSGSSVLNLGIWLDQTLPLEFIHENDQNGKPSAQWGQRCREADCRGDKGNEWKNDEFTWRWDGTGTGTGQTKWISGISSTAMEQRGQGIRLHPQTKPITHFCLSESKLISNWLSVHSAATQTTTLIPFNAIMSKAKSFEPRIRMIESIEMDETVNYIAVRSIRLAAGKRMVSASPPPPFGFLTLPRTKAHLDFTSYRLIRFEMISLIDSLYWSLN